GKANGEGRFYSKSGDVFFGHFEDGWRHGHFLCITVDGTRCIEIWNEGVLMSRQQLDADAVLWENKGAGKRLGSNWGVFGFKSVQAGLNFSGSDFLE
ncbi:hypothetical protein Gotri_022752, partial [Gossypium trilobum]|nr:hypothetical protein [Gossypium trilobum]